MTFYFYSPQYFDKAIVIVDIDEDLTLPRVKVDLGSIWINQEVYLEFGL